MSLLRTITSDRIPEKHRSMLLGKTDATLFHTPAINRAYKRVRKLTEIKQRVPTWDDIVDDPSFSSEVRDYLSEMEGTEIKSRKKTQSTIERLDKYRKLRDLFEMGRDILAFYDQKDELDPDEIADLLASKLAQARKEFGKEQHIYSFGVGGNVSALVKKVLYDPKEAMYKTGYIEYDTRNGGLPTTGVMILAGTTSGGKSVLANNLLHNLATLNRGLSGVKITLEMTDEQETNRILSMISGVPFWKIKQQKLSALEKTKIMKAAKAYDRQLKKMKSKFSYVSPKGSTTIDDVINMVKPYGYKVVVLDYISLLDGVDDDNQWRMLSAICRKAKVYATEYKVLFIVLAQLDSDSSNLRYSRGMKEHADVVWTWNYSKEEQRALKILPVKIAKARDGELFGLDLQDQFEIMRVSNPPGLEHKFGQQSTHSDADEDDDSDIDVNVLS